MQQSDEWPIVVVAVVDPSTAGRVDSGERDKG